MKKKVIKLLIFGLVLFSFFMYQNYKNSFVYAIVNGVEYTYELSEDGTYYIITGINEYNSSIKNIVFPSEYNNLPIKEVKKEVSHNFVYSNLYFEGTMYDWCDISFETYSANPMYFAENIYMLNNNGEYEWLKEIVIPEGIEEIKSYSFVNSDYDFKKIVLPKSLKKIQVNGFSNVGWLYDVYYNGTVADWCNIVLEDDCLIENSENVYFLNEQGVFYKVIDLIIPDTVEYIGKYAFSGFDDIIKIYLSKSVKRIDVDAFNLYSNSRSVYYDGTITDWCNIDFENDESNPLQHANKFYLFDDKSGYVLQEDLIIPSDVTIIKQYQFYGDCFKNVYIHKGVKEVKKSAFGRYYSGYINGYLYYNGNIKDWCNIIFEDSISNPLNTTKGFYISNGTSNYSLITNLVIPGDVKKIGDYQFAHAKNIKTVTINSGVLEIGVGAFSYSEGLAIVNIADSVTVIGENAFYICYDLESLNLPNKLEVLESGVLNSLFVEEITIPNSIKEIKIKGVTNTWKTIKYQGTLDEWQKIVGSNVILNGIANFYYLDETNNHVKLTDLVIEEGVTSLDKRYIDGYLGLKNVYLPDTLKNVSADFFLNCSNLENVYYDGTLTDWFEIKFENGYSNPITYCKHFYVKSYTEYIEVTNFEIPKELTIIPSNIISNFNNLTIITLNKNVEKIESNAFNNCVNLGSVYYRGTLVDWLNIEFENETSNPLYYADHFFVLDSNNAYVEVTEIVIPEGIETIGKYQFNGYVGTTKVVLPDSLVEVSEYAFNGVKCRVLEIGKNIEYVGEKGLTFYKLSNSELYFKGTILDWLTISDECRINCGMNKISLLDESGKLNEIKEVRIPDEVTVIPEKAFYGFLNIEKVIIPSSVELIKQKAFYLTNLKELVFEENLNGLYIETEGFVSKITEIYYQGTTDGWLKTEYQDSSALPFNYSTNIYFLNGNNEYEILKTLVVSDNIEKINNYAAPLKSLEEVVISASVKTIGMYAFTGCSNLKKVIFEDGSTLKEIGSNAFYNCTSLESIEIPNSVTSIGFSAFSDCKNLKNVTINEDSQLQVIGVYSFKGSGIEEIRIPSSVISIRSDAFYSCSKLKTVIIDENSSLEIIGENAFYYTNVKSLYIPKSIKIIGSDIFSSSNITYYFDGNIVDWCNIQMDVYDISINSKILVKDQNGDYAEQTEITIPKEIEKITNLFWTSALTTVYYEGTLADWLNIEFCSYYCNPKYYADVIYFKNEQGEYYEPTEIVIPDNINRIGDYQFYGFDKITKVEIHSDVNYLGVYAFSDCENLEEVIFEENSKIAVLSKGCFSECRKLRIFNTPENIYSIEDYAFQYCYQLTSFVIPASVNIMSYYAFNYCYNLNLIYNLSDIAIDYSYIDYSMLVVDKMDDLRITIIDDYIFIKKDGVNYLTGYTGKDEHLELPFTVNGEKYIISDYTFYKKDFIKSVKISDFTTQIGNYAFYDCVNLEEVIIKESSLLETIKPYAFNNCKSLEYFVIPKKVTDLDDDMFSNCKNVKVVYNLASFNESTIKYIFPSVIAVYNTIEKDVFKEYEGFVFIRIRDEYKLIDYIGNDVNIVLPTDFEGHNYTIYKKAFDDSEQIESIVITKGVIGFDDYALSSIANLKEVVFEDVIFTELSEYLLAYCKNLEKIELPSTVTVIPNRAFYECGSLKEVIIPDGVTTIGSGAFELCVNLENINIPASLLEIKASAFKNCTSLDTFYINNNITTLNNNIFNGCTSLERITIPASVTNIYSSAFYNCTSLKEVIFEENSQLLNIGYSAFEGCISLEEISIPKHVATIEDRVFAGCSNLEIIYLTNNITKFGINAFTNCNSLEKVYYAGTINNWMDIYFDYYSSKDFFANPISLTKEFYVLVDNEYELVETLTFDNNRTYIPSRIFSGYKGLKKIILSSSIKEIYSYAFYNCTSLEEIEFVSGLEKIYSDAFAECSSLVKLNLPEGIKTLSTYVFDGCVSLEEIFIPSTVETFSIYSMFEWYNIKNIIVDSRNMNYQSIDGNLYTKDGTELLIYGYGKEEEEFVIPEGVTTIGTYALIYAKKLKTIKLPISLLKINNPDIYRELGYKFLVYENSYGLTFVTENNLNYEIVEMEIVRGDLNSDLRITIDDVIYLLMYTYFPSAYEINQYPDFNKDGVINTDDAIYLLMHIYFPNQYPLS